MDQPLILHIPHSSVYIPLKGGYLVSESALGQEILTLTDWYTDDLYDSPIDEKVIAGFSRIFCDVERFEDDSKEKMSQFGKGLLSKKNRVRPILEGGVG